MIRLFSLLAAFLALVAGLTAADANAPNWSEYVVAGELVADVTKADKNGVTIVSFLKLSPAGKIIPPPKVDPKKGGFNNLFNRLTLEYAEHGSARWANANLIVDKSGKKVELTPEQKKERLLPEGAPGLAAERTDVKPGQSVKLILVREKKIKVNELTTGQLQIKHAIILGPAQNPDPKK